MTQAYSPDRKATLAIVREIRGLIDQTLIGISWPSDELQTSYSERSSRRHGPGEEERGMKQYEVGDDINNIHLAATLASTDPDEILIRTFFHARVLRFNVLLDVGASMHFGTHNTLKTRLGAACAGAGLQSAIQAQDIPSYITFANRPLTSRIEQNSSDLLFESLMHFVGDGSRAYASNAEKPVGGGIAKSYEAVRDLDRSVNMVVSDFAFVNASDWEALRLMGAQHDTIAVFVQDPRERELPEVPWPGATYEFEDAQGTAKSIWVTPARLPGWLSALMGKLTFGKTVTSRQEYSENFKRHEEAVIARLKKCGITPVIVSTEKAKDDVRKLVRQLARETR